MKNVRRLVPASLALGVVILVAVPAGLGSGNAVGPIRITSREISYQRVDVGKPGLSAGDSEIIKQSLYNRSVTTKSIGHADILCTFIDKRARSCRDTYFLPRGKIVVGGSIRYRQFYDLAVLGGTGIYADARGTLTVTRTATEPNRDIVLFRLVG